MYNAIIERAAPFTMKRTGTRYTKQIERFESYEDALKWLNETDPAPAQGETVSMYIQDGNTFKRIYERKPRKFWDLVNGEIKTETELREMFNGEEGEYLRDDFESFEEWLEFALTGYPIYLKEIA